MTDVVMKKPLQWKKQGPWDALNDQLIPQLEEIKKALIAEKNRLQQQVIEMKKSGNNV